jgi:hypothetical protein
MQIFFPCNPSIKHLNLALTQIDSNQKDKIWQEKQTALQEGGGSSTTKNLLQDSPSTICS